MTYDRIPDQLKSLPNWFVWSLRDGAKIPFTITGEYGKSNDPSTWSTYSEAVEIAPSYDGLAFVISEESGLCGVDLDNCLDRDGVKEWALPIIAELNGVAYAEISPSGNGIKFLTRAKKHAPTCLYRFGGKREQLECYDKSRFWCVTGDVFENQTTISDGQHAINWIGEEYLTPEKKTSSESLASLSDESHILQKRALAYVDRIPPASEGNRNNDVYKVAGGLRRIDQHGLRLTDHDVLQLVMLWNSRCDPPLPVDEVRRTIFSNLRNGQPREPLPADDIWQPSESEVDVSGLISNQRRLDPPLGDIPTDLFGSAPGLLGSVYQWLMQSSMFPLPEVSFAAALTLLSVITGHKIRGDRNTRTNLYCLSVAPTGSGKDHPRSAIQYLLESTDALHLIGNEDIGSGPGLCSMLQAQPVALCAIDELGRLVAQFTSDRANQSVRAISTDLLKIYTSSHRMFIGRAYAQIDRSPRIDQPHLVLNGTTTAETLWPSLTTEQIHDGLIGRLNIFEAREYVRMQKKPAEVENIPDTILSGVRYWLDYKPDSVGNVSMSPRPTDMTYDDDARERLENHLDNIATRRINDDKMTAAIWSRSGEKAHKISLIAAAACLRLNVSIDDVNWAIALQNALTRRLMHRIKDNVSENATEASKKRMMSILAERNEWSRSDLCRRTQNLTRSERDAIVEDLVQSGHAVIRKSESTRGRPSVYISRRT